MNYMFQGCSSMATASDASNWDTSAVTNMVNMFQNCSSMATAPDVRNWNIESLTNATSFMSGSTPIETSVYDEVLVNWEAQVAQLNVSCDFGTSKYTTGGAGETARNVLTGTSGWTITDGGGA
jgi:surface protein